MKETKGQRQVVSMQKLQERHNS